MSLAFGASISPLVPTFSLEVPGKFGPRGEECDALEEFKFDCGGRGGKALFGGGGGGGDEPSLIPVGTGGGGGGPGGGGPALVGPGFIPVDVGGGGGSPGGGGPGLIPVAMGGGGSGPDEGGPALIGGFMGGGDGKGGWILFDAVDGSVHNLTVSRTVPDDGFSSATDDLAILDSFVVWLISTDGTCPFWLGLVL